MANPKKIQKGRIGVFALAMLNIVAVVSLRGLPAEAEYGLKFIFLLHLCCNCIPYPRLSSRG